jgi:hypothetical protein
MAVDHDSLIYLTATSRSADIGAASSSVRNLIANKADLWRLPPKRVARIADCAEWLVADQTDPFPVM